VYEAELVGEHVKVEIGAVTVGAEHEVCQMRLLGVYGLMDG